MSSVKSTKQAAALLLFISFVISSLIVPLVLAAEDSWTTMEPMPTARSGLGVAVVDGKIYAIGGYNGSYLNVNEMYDPETDTWTTKQPLLTARAWFAIAAYGGRIYAIGGEMGASTPVYSGYTGLNEVYDPTTDTWETLEPMPTARSSLCANVVDEKIYLIEGTKHSNVWPFSQVPSVTEVYDPATDSWSTRTPIPGTTFGYASAVVDNKIYVFGDSFPESNTTRIYNPKTDTWSLGTSVPSEVMGSSAGVTTGELAPQRIYVLGGNYGSAVSADFNQIYAPETDKWTAGMPMPTPRWSLGVAVVNDELYAIGGKIDVDTYLTVNEKYTPAGYIPEFHSWVPILVMCVTFAAILKVYKRKLRNV